MTDTADRVAMRFAEAIKGVVKDELRRRGLDWGYCDADVKIDIDKSLVEVTAAALSSHGLRELIENYDELYAAFKSSPYEPFFD